IVNPFAAMSIRSVARSVGNPSLYKEPLQHLVGVKILLGQGAGGPAVPLVVAGDPFRSSDGLVESAERNQPLANGQEGAESCVLNEGGLAGRQVAHGPVAEPTAAGIDVDPLGN